MPTTLFRIFVRLLAVSAVFSCRWLPVDQPNVVILFTDDQCILDVNCYGAADLKTPNMDKLASTGIRFTQAYSHKVCCPASLHNLIDAEPEVKDYALERPDLVSELTALHRMLETDFASK